MISVKGYGAKRTLLTAINITPGLQGLSVVLRNLYFGCLIFLLVAGVCTGLIVTRMTANLRHFARSLDAVDPAQHIWTPAAPPTSAEEHLLYLHFGSMLGSMREASKTQKLFIANASHELKTPVAGMLMALQVALSRPRPVEFYQSLCQDLLKSVLGLKRLSTALLELIRVETVIGAQIGAIDASELLATLVDRWQAAASARNVVLSCAPIAPGLVLHSHRELLEVAIGNIIDNGIKYSHEGGHVDISLTVVAPQSIVIVIRDHGIGISPTNMNRLGEVFFRASESRSDELSFGIGLAHTMRIIKSLGGRVEITSVEDRGTEVTMYLLRS